MRLHNFAHHLLTLCRHVDEGIQAPHEERNAIGFKLPLDQRARASQLLRNIADGSADMRQCNLMVPAQSAQDVSFHKIVERQECKTTVGQLDDRVGALAPF